MLKKRLRINLLKYCHNFYQNSKFLINKKKKNKYYMINATIKINKVIVRNTNISFNIKEFAKEFIEIIIALLINFFLEYN